MREENQNFNFKKIMARATQIARIASKITLDRIWIF